MDLVSRRDVMVKGIPAAVAAGTVLTGFHALAQDGGQRAAGGEPAGGRKENAVHAAVAQAFEGGQYKLPPLPYDYNALEPHIDEQTMRLHHDKHHLAYVNGLNKAVAAAREMKGEIDTTKLETVQRDLSFHGGGHVLHTIFWATMAPGAGGQPQGAIADAINTQYGSFDQFKAYFSKAAGIVKGSGWAVLCYEPVGDALLVFSLNEHDTKLIAGAYPLLPIDVWEHAYYLKYQNNRTAYIDAWWNVVNWNAVNGTYEWLRSRFVDADEK
jgi:superoxide dismutase, Fe-Mn family